MFKKFAMVNDLWYKKMERAGLFPDFWVSLKKS
jgi:hypothetical protein